MEPEGSSAKLVGDDCVLFAERANEFIYSDCLSPSGAKA